MALTDKINIKCTNCGNEFTLTQRALRNRMDKGTPMYCKSCLQPILNKQKKLWYINLSKEEKDNYRNVRKAAYQNWTPEQKEAHSQRTKDQLASRTQEEWAIINKKNSEGLKRHWATVSEEDKIKRISPMLHAAWASWENMTQEQKHERATSWMRNKSKEEIDMRMYLLSERMKDYNNSLSYEEKLRRVNHMNEYMNSLSYNDRREIAKKAHAWLDNKPIEEVWEYYKNNLKTMIPKCKMNDTEVEFVDLMKVYGFEHLLIHQCVNEIADKNILNEFPDTKNPYHIWDFKIRLSDKDIYVDIDGSIHTLVAGKNYTRDGIDIGAVVQRRDIERKYQTDGLDAYAVLAYNDKINMDTPVIKIGCNETCTVKDLVNIIKIGTMSKKDIRELIKNNK